MRVALVVDDDADWGDVTEFLLERAGFEVHRQPDGAGGLAIARKLHPDLVLLDWMMPHMSGVEVCRALRSDIELASTKIIILSAKFQKDDIDQGYSAGADDYIVKPFKPKDLIDRIEAVMARVA
jgi:DNA-binding response OmpR family regulator